MTASSSEGPMARAPSSGVSSSSGRERSSGKEWASSARTPRAKMTWEGRAERTKTAAMPAGPGRRIEISLYERCGGSSPRRRDASCERLAAMRSSMLTRASARRWRAARARSARRPPCCARSSRSTRSASRARPRRRWRGGPTRSRAAAAHLAEEVHAAAARRRQRDRRALVRVGRVGPPAEEARPVGVLHRLHDGELRGEERERRRRRVGRAPPLKEVGHASSSSPSRSSPSSSSSKRSEWPPSRKSSSPSPLPSSNSSPPRGRRSASGVSTPAFSSPPTAASSTIESASIACCGALPPVADDRAHRIRLGHRAPWPGGLTSAPAQAQIADTVERSDATCDLGLRHRRRRCAAAAAGSHAQTYRDGRCRILHRQFQLVHRAARRHQRATHRRRRLRRRRPRAALLDEARRGRGFDTTYVQAAHNLVLCVGSLAMALGTLLEVYRRASSDAEGARWLFCERASTAPTGALWFWSYVYYLSKYYELLDTVLQLFKGRPPPALLPPRLPPRRRAADGVESRSTCRRCSTSRCSSTRRSTSSCTTTTSAASSAGPSGGSGTSRSSSSCSSARRRRAASSRSTSSPSAATSSTGKGALLFNFAFNMTLMYQFFGVLARGAEGEVGSASTSRARVYFIFCAPVHLTPGPRPSLSTWESGRRAAAALSYDPPPRRSAIAWHRPRQVVLGPSARREHACRSPPPSRRRACAGTTGRRPRRATSTSARRRTPSKSRSRRRRRRRRARSPRLELVRRPPRRELTLALLDVAGPPLGRVDGEHRDAAAWPSCDRRRVRSLRAVLGRLRTSGGGGASLRTTPSRSTTPARLPDCRRDAEPRRATRSASSARGPLRADGEATSSSRNGAEGGGRGCALKVCGTVGCGAHNPAFRRGC